MKLFGDAANIAAIQQWRCPCSDRNCLDETRVKFLELYDTRNEFHKEATNELGGSRLTKQQKCYQRLLQHYDANGKAFTRSFVVGKCGDVCAPAAGLVWGVSFQTWASARANVTQGRAPMMVRKV